MEEATFILFSTVFEAMSIFSNYLQRCIGLNYLSHQAYLAHFSDPPRMIKFGTKCIWRDGNDHMERHILKCSQALWDY